MYFSFCIYPEIYIVDVLKHQKHITKFKRFMRIYGKVYWYMFSVPEKVNRMLIGLLVWLDPRN